MNLLCRSIVTAMLAAAAGSALAATPQGSVGAWTLKLDDGSRECTMMLRAESLGSAYALGVPPGCRHAFPAVAAVTAWRESDEGQIELVDKGGQPLIRLAPSGDNGLTGVGPDGGIYRMEPVGPHKGLALKPAELAPTVAMAATAASGTPAPPAASHPLPTVAEVAGHYAVLRDKTRDTGCMVTLDPKVRGAKGMLKANLAPACRDQGIVVFDPVAWELVGGRLVLMARKGHTTKFDMQEDSTWLKDPKDGKSMGLKRL